MSVHKHFYTKKRNLIIIISVFVVFLYIFDYKMFYFEPRTHKYTASEITKCERDLKSHKTVIERYYEKRQNWQTSNLGSILFKNENQNEFIQKDRTDKIFIVLVWRFYDWLKNRHVYNFSHEKDKDPLEECSVKNCKFTGEEKELNNADAVVIQMQRGIYPDVKNRNKNQRWIFLSDESPKNTFTLARSPPKLKNLSGIFNWTMTYRSDSDIPVPYGRTIPLPQPAPAKVCSGNAETTLSYLVPYWDEKQFVVLAMVLMSNCKVKKRMDFLSTLRSYMTVDIHGRCSDEDKNTCPGHFRSECKVTRQYLFYLVIENSSCRQYLTEKCFQHAYSKGAIPVIMGPPLQDCQKLLPPNSFLHVDSYKTVYHLVEHMKQIAKNYENILSYHVWRKHFGIVNEHGYFGSRSYHFCRVCEALNYNDNEENVYDIDDLKLFFSAKISCDTQW